MTEVPTGTPTAFPETVPAAHDAALSDPARLRALAATGLMDVPSADTLDRVTRLATRLMGVPVSLLSLVDDRRQVFASAQGLSLRETPLSHSFCQYVVSSGRPLDVADARTHPLLHRNGAIPDLKVIAYMGHPVRTADGQVIGSLCTISDGPRAWSDDDRACLADLAAMVETELHLRREAARNQLLHDETQHRIRNLFALASAIVRMTSREAPAADTATDTGVPGFARTLIQRFGALNAAHAASMQRGSAGPGECALAAAVTRTLAPYMTDPSRAIDPDSPPVRLAPDRTTYMALALHELATNAVKYGGLADGRGDVRVTWRRAEDGSLHLDWVEEGVPEPASTRVGFGSQMLSDAIEAGLMGRFDRRFADGRLIVTIVVPPDVMA